MKRGKAGWRAVRLLILDVDGVLTPRQIVLDSEGGDLKYFSVRDGRALKRWISADRPAALLSARRSEATARRAAELGIETVVQGCAAKVEGYEVIRGRYGMADEAVCFIGDDWTDLPVLERVGLPVAVADADPLVRVSAAYVTDAAGGDGAVCEVIERLLRAQGLWSGPGEGAQPNEAGGV